MLNLKKNQKKLVLLKIKILSLTDRLVNRIIMTKNIGKAEQIRIKRKKEIMDVALRLFGTFGYHATSISHIAKEAGISKGLIYNYFESKEQLLKEIFDSGKDSWLSNLGEIEIKTKKDFEKFINALFKLITGFENKEWFKLYYAMMLQPTVFDILEKEIEMAHKDFLVNLMNYFAKNGSEDPEMDVLILHSAIEGTVFQYIYAPKAIDFKRVKKVIIKRFA